MNFIHTFASSAVVALLMVAAAGARDAERTGVQREMQRMDTNQDGKVSASEHASGARQMFLTMDANRDGKVTAAEMDAAHQFITGRAKDSQQRSSASKINVIDADKDGVLTAEEHAQGSQRMFAVMDSNQDGELTAQEMQAGRERMRKY